MNKASIGIIGGSGLYEIEGARVIEEVSVDTPWGTPSDVITITDIDGITVAFLPRHGRGHPLLPHEVNYRANIAALKMTGVEEIVAFSAVGSLKEEIEPLHFVVPDQIIDRIRARHSTFFGNGVAAHISFADPFCERLRRILIEGAQDAAITTHDRETLICMEGPAFSTRAESNLYRSWGAGVINMSTSPEAKLAREAEICYSVVCMSTDYDCWHETEEHVSVEMVIKNLTINSNNAKKLLKGILPALAGNRDCDCSEASRNAILTSEEARDREQIKRLKAIFPDMT